ncbi:cysteine-rich CWC family protein [Shewanella litorisediminis]|uniref:Cysteine-rich CWC family protein n=1 Tax=Shewanella litorisediminis TaxID=1173586 RepID=A0ABX7G223_9GAMM|nr:cysteine-rich CWC family protein [Shewanella litorisediminis]MCL2918549.1 cysteine-rich CWC family protein [Shewanella litorisediminis]QRH01375.1 cysteine-rich CWC family protein [Shewanella litorisediminis]
MTNPNQCPLCQNNNDCAVQNGKSIDTCWCLGAPFPKQLPEVMSSCLCQRCAERLAKVEKLGLKQVK